MIELRAATANDLAGIHRTWWSTEPQPGRNNPWFSHVIRTGRMAVAEEAGRVVGFGGYRRIGITGVISDFYVESGRQGQGIGTRLLQFLVPEPEPLMTLASTDPKARALYGRWGMEPVSNCPYVRGAGASTGLTVEAADSYPVSPEDRRHLVDDLGAHLVAIGSGSVAAVTGHSIETSIIGDGDDPIAVMGSLLAHVGGPVEVQVSEQHPAYAAFRWDLTDSDSLMATPDAEIPDYTRITFNGDLLDIRPNPGQSR